MGIHTEILQDWHSYFVWLPVRLQDGGWHTGKVERQVLGIAGQTTVRRYRKAS